MGDYYNKTKGPIPVSTRRGSSIVIGSKKWATIAPEDEGHESLNRAVTKGYLVRGRSSAPTPIPLVATVPVAVTAPAPAPVAPVVPAPDVEAPVEPVAKTVPPAESKPEASPVAPVARSGRKGR